MPSTRIFVRTAALGAAVCAALALRPTGAAAQAHQHTPPAKPAQGGEQHHMSGWKAMDAFHMLMMRTWHPAKSSNDLAPIRAKADSMALRAAEWAKDAVPTACDTKVIRDAIASVATDSRTLAQLVAKRAPDADVKSALSALHDRFEVVEEGCKPGHH